MGENWYITKKHGHKHKTQVRHRQTSTQQNFLKIRAWEHGDMTFE